MDLGFNRNRPFGVAGARPARYVVPQWPFMLAASAAAQAASPTARACADILRGQDDGQEDWVQALARIFAPDAGGVIDAAALCGSFDPSVAHRLRVGQGR